MKILAREEGLAASSSQLENTSRPKYKEMVPMLTQLRARAVRPSSIRLSSAQYTFCTVEAKVKTCMISSWVSDEKPSSVRTRMLGQHEALAWARQPEMTLGEY